MGMLSVLARQPIQRAGRPFAPLPRPGSSPTIGSTGLPAPELRFVKGVSVSLAGTSNRLVI